MTAAKKQSVNPELDGLMTDLLKRVKKALKQETSETIPGLMDMIRVVDRCIQWEKVKYQIKDDDWGKGFDDDETPEGWVMDERLRISLLYVSMGLKVLSARLMMLLTLLLTFVLFCWAMWNPNYLSIACATIFAVLVYLPTVRLDKSTKEARAVVSPQEPS